MTFDASENVHLINERLLMMAEKTADTFYSTEKTYSNATGIKDRELSLFEDAQHIETYWKPDYVKQESEKLIQ
ncbi:peptidase S15 [Leuconostoc mesenteroides]|uniref:Uncharacterized protein n=2 Tax=Leuconostoc mesenteroides TaxID=1245 RepID=Q03X80_LEUMM|nr:hypothetical protein [Leuconostoc mesenteroides]ABJ62192.1 hypothetical protein LEUM_1092 [Leuconostoc mesenteroides subsp. mesenteroides ATCC 8293]MDG9747097.1 peptidase S15 [Leuconostoc mesenteroides]QQB31013.1 peptidase S15 [Leuconostoc mesenteroides]GEL85470.1 hypothetical protein LME03_18180 [Leuconostoc mesenteroides subsp. mesenteroides]